MSENKVIDKPPRRDSDGLGSLVISDELSKEDGCHGDEYAGEPTTPAPSGPAGDSSRTRDCVSTPDALQVAPSDVQIMRVVEQPSTSKATHAVQYVDADGRLVQAASIDDKVDYADHLVIESADEVNKLELVTEVGDHGLIQQVYDHQGKITEIDATQLLNLQHQGAFMVENGMIVSSENIVACENGQEEAQFQTVNINQDGTIQGQDGDNYIIVVSEENGQTTERVVNANDFANSDMSVYDFKEDKNAMIMQEEGDDQNEQHIQYIDKDNNAAFTNGADISDSCQQFMCNYCSFVTPKRSLLTQHQQHHEVERASAHIMQAQLMCNYCNYTSPKRYLLTRHMKTHSEERPHICTICDRGFKTIASLQNHVNTHTGFRPHKCKECDSAFTTSGELVRHVRYRHTYEKPHKCPECDYSSVELSKLKRHIRSHTGERPYQCPHCVYASPDTYKLKRHLRIHTGERPYECDICNARFTQSNSLKAHKLIHSGDKPVFQCELCPTTCGRKTDLKIHVMKLHTSDTPMQCKKCGKSFPDRYTYKIHTKTHEGEKCFKCELCSYAAMSQRHLESHILTHTGEKPYHCNECVQSFRQKQLLRRHKNLYHTPDYHPPTPKDKHFRCIECRKTFANEGNLLRHMLPDNHDYRDQLALIYENESNNRIEYTHQDANGAEYIKCDQQMLSTQEGEQVQVLMSKDGELDEQPIYVQVMPQGSYLPDDILEVTEVVEAGDAGEHDAIHLLVAASERQQRLQELHDQREQRHTSSQDHIEIVEEHQVIEAGPLEGQSGVIERLVHDDGRAQIIESEPLHCQATIVEGGSHQILRGQVIEEQQTQSLLHHRVVDHSGMQIEQIMQIKSEIGLHASTIISAPEPMET